MTVAAISGAIIGLDDAKRYLRQADDEHGELIQDLVNKLSGQVYRYTARKLLSAAYVSETHNGDGSSELILDQYPVTLVSAIREIADYTSTRTLDITNYRVSSRGVLYVPRDSFGKGFRNIQVDYTGGYKSPDHDLELEAIRLAFSRWLQVAFQDWRDGVGRGTGFSVGGEAVTLIDVPMPRDVAAALAPFRRLS